MLCEKNLSLEVLWTSMFHTHANYFKLSEHPKTLAMSILAATHQKAYTTHLLLIQKRTHLR
jgi:hypothetical protein